VAWGLFHALILVAETLFRRPGRKSRPTTTADDSGDRSAALTNRGGRRHRVSWLPGMLYCFLVWTFSLILFRAVSLHQAGLFIERLFAPGTPWIIPADFEVRTTLIYSIFGIACVLAADIGKEFVKGSGLWMYHRNATVRMSAYAALAVIILLLGVFDGGQFIYFQF
jgi:D-alanyl-lipoteichoic acid acyltransferase DltB (MBOAT superfamily)